MLKQLLAMLQTVSVVSKDVRHPPSPPLSLQQRLKTDEYRSVPSFISDVQLLLDNAKRFYKKGSEELGNVMTLEDAFLQRLQEFWEDPEGEGSYLLFVWCVCFCTCVCSHVHATTGTFWKPFMIQRYIWL